MLFWFVCAHAQTTPPVSFSYDPDGNMTARYVVKTEAPKTRSSEENTNSEQKSQTEDILSVVLGEQTISIYPNPTTGNITLGVTPLDSRQKNFLRLYNSFGQLLITMQIHQDLTPLEIKGPAGIYLLDIYLGENVSQWKIIKE